MISAPHYKTLVISDVHLGTRGSRSRELVRFLKTCTFDRLIMNGDIIDGWQLQRSGKWKKQHTRFFKLLMKWLRDTELQVIYVRGNHDDFLDQILPFEIGNFHIVRDFEFESFGKRYLVVHGDLFDPVTQNIKWLSHLGDWGYTLLLNINRFYNHYRRKKGLPYYSLSRDIKMRVKSAVSFIGKFETCLVDYAKIRNCNAVICGHIHTPAIRQMGDILYLNSGDWVESLSALAEDQEGNWHLLFWEDFQKKEVNKKSELDESLDSLILPDWIAGQS